MASAIESETVLRERPAKPADGAFPFDDGGFVLSEMMSGAQAGEATSEDHDLLHDFMSTFIRR